MVSPLGWSRNRELGETDNFLKQVAIFVCALLGVLIASEITVSIPSRFIEVFYN
jgi:hypothetical protein